jgi:murein hydrolase activator
MVNNSIYYIFLIILFLAFNILPQEREKIEVKKNELSDLKSKISKLEDELKQKTEKEKESFEVLENYNKQNYLLRKLIRRLKNQENAKQREIDINNRKIKSIEKQISALKNNYSKYVIAIYKYGEVNELASLLDAESVEQALVRYKYLQKFSERRSKDLQSYRDNISELNKIKARLEKEKLEKKLLADQKQKEENGLEAKQKERKKILNAIRHDKTSLKKELEAKKIAEAKINQMIVKLIAEAEQRRKEEAERIAGLNKTPVNHSIPEENMSNVSPSEPKYNVNLNTSDFTSFSNLKGKLHWPIQNATVIRKYGKNVNNNLNTVTLNYGVDIKASSDLDVKAVAEGIVSAIDWIPGYGSVVIITHKGDYRTVYSHLSDLYVTEGDKVNLGKVIGRVGESLEGNVLHFEIWNSRVNQNPESWLVKK